MSISTRRILRSSLINGRTPLGSLQQLTELSRLDNDPLRRLEKREWDLWCMAFLVVVALAVGVSSLYLMHSQGSTPVLAGRWTAGALVLCLLGLVGVVLTYVGRRRRALMALRQHLIREQGDKNELSARLGELRLLLNVAQELQATLGFSGVLRRCVELTNQLIGADRAAVLVFDGRKLDVAAWLAADESWVESDPTAFLDVLKSNAFSRGEAWMTSRSERLEQVLGDSSWTRDAAGTFMCPLRSGSRTFGILLAQQIMGSESTPFGDYHKKLMSIFGGIASHVLAVAQAQRRLKQSNDRLKSSMRKLERAQGQLVQVEKLTALGDLVSGVAHELNNPLTSVAGYSQVLLSMPDQKLVESRRYLECIQAEAMRCSVIVGNLLSFARGPSGRGGFEPVVKVVEDILSLRAYDFRRMRIDCRVDIPADLPIPAIERGQLQLVVLNLVNNALWAMRESERRTLVISAQLRGGHVHLAVKDTGEGISDRVLSRIFEPFFSTKQKGDGIGLGLSTCATVLEACEGSVSVESGEGKGSVFTLHLPVASAAVPVGV